MNTSKYVKKINDLLDRAISLDDVSADMLSEVAVKIVDELIINILCLKFEDDRYASDGELVAAYALEDLANSVKKYSFERDNDNFMIMHFKKDYDTFKHNVSILADAWYEMRFVDHPAFTKYSYMTHYAKWHSMLME
jgi:hypothetical protein